jgi:hypothetical protein
MLKVFIFYFFFIFVHVKSYPNNDNKDKFYFYVKSYQNNDNNGLNQSLKIIKD